MTQMYKIYQSYIQFNISVPQKQLRVSSSNKGNEAVLTMSYFAINFAETRRAFSKELQIQ